MQFLASLAPEPVFAMLRNQPVMTINRPGISCLSTAQWATLTDCLEFIYDLVKC